MFDDPQKELKRLEEQLLKLEEKDDEFERFYQDIFAEFGAAEEDTQPVPAAPVKKQSAYADTPRAVAPKKKKKKKKGVKGLVITVCLELLAIGGIVVYWLMRLL